MTLIIGSEGSMGKRYQAILRHLGENFSCADIGMPILPKHRICDRYIVCTPTDTHYNILKSIIPLGKPILCEKPITKSLTALADIFSMCKQYNTQFNMTFQYSELASKDQLSYQVLDSGDSSYDYFRTGNDSLIWDCLQIIGLANGPVEIKNDSPIWKCKINGKYLSLADMDGAYVSFVKKWINGEINQNHDDLYKIHEKVEKMANGRS